MFSFFLFSPLSAVGVWGFGLALAGQINTTIEDLDFYRAKLGSLSTYRETRLRRAEILFLSSLPISYAVVSSAYSGVLYLKRGSSSMTSLDYVYSLAIASLISSALWLMDSIHYKKYLREDAWKANVVRNLNSKGVSTWPKESTTGR